MLNQLIEKLTTTTIAISAIAFLCKLCLEFLDKRSLEAFKYSLQDEAQKAKSLYEIETVKNQATIKEIGRWSNTLLSATNGITGRLKYLKNNHIDINDEYLRKSTAYYLCQFLCWKQLYRKDRDMVVLSPANDEIIISSLLQNISTVIRDNNTNHPVIRSLEQRYIGEKLIIEKECMQYSHFIDNDILVDYPPLYNFVDALIKKENLIVISLFLEKLMELQKHMNSIIINTHIKQPQ